MLLLYALSIYASVLVINSVAIVMLFITGLLTKSELCYQAIKRLIWLNKKLVFA